jgi:fatty acid desaturase (delta-4 desaturase)
MYSTSKDRNMDSESLSKHSNLIAIEDSVYDLTLFNHPGGDDIRIFGGHDVTPHYRSLHPNHNSDHYKKVLNNCKVGNYNINPKDCSYGYIYDSQFATELKQEIKGLLPYTYATNGFYLRCLFYMSLWVVGLLGYTFYPCIFFSLIFGASRALVSLNIMHDANHGSVSKNPNINKLFGYTLDLMGDSRYIWIQHHVIFHHAYTEDYICDPDSSAAEPFVILKPNKGKKNKYQHMYLFILFSFYGFSKIFNKENFTLKYGLNKVDNIWLETKLPIVWLIKVFTLIIDLQIIFYNGLWGAFLFLIMTMTGSLILATLFIISHNFENVTSRDNLSKKDWSIDNLSKKDWYKIQIEASGTYGGWLSGWLTGGLNYQIEHHIFPKINSAHYPTIAPVVRELCLKYGVKYNYFPTLYDNLKSMFSYVKQ